MDNASTAGRNPSTLSSSTTFDRALEVSLFTGANDNKPERVSLSWEVLLTEHLARPHTRVSLEDARTCATDPAKHESTIKRIKNAQPAFSPATFDGPRSKANVRAISCAVLDLDGLTNEALDDIDDRVRGYEHVITSTFSHGWGKPGHALRIILPFNRDVSPEEWPHVWRAVNNELAGGRNDRATKDESRIYFLPTAPIEAPDLREGQKPDEGWLKPLKPNPVRKRKNGKAVDVDALLLRNPPPTPTTAPARPGTAPQPRNANQDKLARRGEAYLETMPPSFSGQNGSIALFNATRALVTGFCLDDATALALLRTQFNPRCEPPWEDADLERKISEAHKTEADYGKPRGYLLAAEADDNAPPIEPVPTARQLAFDGESESSPLAFKTTETGNAERFVHRYRGLVRHCIPLKAWLFWNGTQWQRDERGEVERMCKETVRSIYEEAAQERGDDTRRAALAKHAANSESAKARSNMLHLARTEPGVPVMPEEMNKDGWLLNVENGTIDLRTGKLREHRREDLITHRAPVRFDPGAKAPLWEKFLAEVLPDEEVRKFVQRLMGYALTGVIREHVFPVFWGRGRNGKGTFVEVMQHVMGSGYAGTVPAELLLAKKDAHPAEKMTLLGKRLAVAQETDQSRALAEALIKSTTGGDRIKARGMHENFVEFAPTHKFVLCTNHKPRIVGTDIGIRSRVKLVPWLMTIEPAKQDTGLVDKLKQEAPGVLAWAVQGCLDWVENGLGEPEAVTQATNDYFHEEDPLSQFIEEKCALDPRGKAKASALFKAFDDWAKANGHQPITPRALGESLGERDLERRKNHGTICWVGIQLLTELELNLREGGGGRVGDRIPVKPPMESTAPTLPKSPPPTSPLPPSEAETPFKPLRRVEIE